MKRNFEMGPERRVRFQYVQKKMGILGLKEFYEQARQCGYRSICLHALKSESVNFSCKWPHNKYFRL